ncbi:hypothetical protein HU200_036607 [Digitaria exilis]|uniref:Reverse transcriptase zinc-binding domain-containing protein n=1 Tax=Digitaria exilis TaxID=1010633 RepID=A0A835BF16_9POAL|nr:hypothetical protein HU200_036607 [Digitaria exilis]
MHHIRALEESYREHCPGTLETIAHIFISCPRAQGVWARLGINVGVEICHYPWLAGLELQLPRATHLDVITLILWHIWKARNAVIFDQHTMTLQMVLRRILNDMDSWKTRYKQYDQEWEAWRLFLSSYG